MTFPLLAKTGIWTRNGFGMKKTDDKAKGRLKGLSPFASVGIAEAYLKGGGRWHGR